MKRPSISVFRSSASTWHRRAGMWATIALFVACCGRVARCGDDVPASNRVGAPEVPASSAPRLRRSYSSSARALQPTGSVAACPARAEPVKRLTLVENLQLQPAPDTGKLASLVLGMELIPVSAKAVSDGDYRGLRGGLAVVDVECIGAAKLQDVAVGDILVGMHKWETVALEHVDYILRRADLESFSPVKFYVLRNGETQYGFLPTGWLKVCANAYLQEACGVTVDGVPPDESQDSDPRHYRGGLRVTEVQEDDAGATHGIEEGDLLIGMHTWSIRSLGDLVSIAAQPELKRLTSVKVCVLRRGRTMCGELPVRTSVAETY